MAASTGSDAPQPEGQSHPARRGRAAQHRRPHRPESQEGPGNETGFWAQLEEREEGRLALEADHLFDTSYPWTA
ncbi:MAG: hypothetical protein OHK0015_53840 [Chloroflexi bacterium OHK40]